jgi:arabinan endo-1,5-alpha-L-arabinosidase
MTRVVSWILAAAALPAAAMAQPASAPKAAAPPALLADRLSGDIAPVHDPSMIRDGNAFYLFTTTSDPKASGFVQVRTSRNLLNWTAAGSVFAAIPEWARHEVPAAKGIWAPDISFSNGQFRLYYAVSSFGSNHSAIGLATTPTLDPSKPGYGWKDQGVVLTSNSKDDYNAIDPAAFTDADGKSWLAFGSFWTGLKMIRLDPATGKPSAEDKTVYSLARRTNPDAVEAPYLIRHGDFYYLFASFDFCCRGADSTYYTVVGRSKSVTGPYLDFDGKPMTKGFAQVVLHGKLDKTKRWRGPGGVAILHEGERDFIVYHAYDAQNKGLPTLRVAPLGWTADGWPVASQ